MHIFVTEKEHHQHTVDSSCSCPLECLLDAKLLFLFSAIIDST